MDKKALFLLTVLAGCSTQPAYERPPVELPAQWEQSAPRYAEDGRWWRIYDDPALSALVEEAMKSNSDLLIAAARVEEARAILGEARGTLAPEVAARGSAARQRISRETATSFAGVPREFSSYRATIDVSYEVDLFGRLRSNVAAARATLEASEAAREAVRLALAAQVAKSYYALRSFEQQVELTRQTVELREQSLWLQRKRRDAGVISEYELAQLEAEAAAVRAQLPPLRQEREREEAALAVLLGRTPQAVFEAEIRTGEMEKLLPTVVPAGLPSELLLRRPDLVEAERSLAATDARVAVARSEMFPSIALTASLGAESASLANLFTGPAGLWALAAGVAQPIFAGGRLEARVDAARARERAARVQYQQAIRAAFGEVRTALTAQARARESYDAQTARAAALEETLRLARLRYQAGVASQLDVIDAERGLLAARAARIDALRAQRAAVADLFRALGG